jgi:hypothetical protein
MHFKAAVRLFWRGNPLKKQRRFFLFFKKEFMCIQVRDTLLGKEKTDPKLARIRAPKCA